MCIIFIAYQQHPQFELIVAANRDEFYKRPTKAAHFWNDEQVILGGRDLEQMGTWMGIARNGRFAGLTNYRAPAEFRKTDKESRGNIVRSFLAGNDDPLNFLQELQHKRNDYRGFNLFISDGKSLMYYSNIENRIKNLQPGIYGLSNHLLDTPWPKVEKGKQRIRQMLDEGTLKHEELFELLTDSEPGPDNKLPATGVSPELERTLSSIFIKSPDYGTRCSTVLTIGYTGKVQFIERTFPSQQEKKVEFQLNSKSEFS